jgi:hypothetical protein
MILIVKENYDMRMNEENPVVDCIKVLSQNSPGAIEENNKVFCLELPDSRPKFGTVTKYPINLEACIDLY